MSLGKKGIEEEAWFLSDAQAVEAPNKKKPL
jgi:hypothetical protein